MKKSTYHIICSWALLICFVTGQYMVFAHQHNIVKKMHAHSCKDDNNTSHVIVKEKCAVCDSMHHTTMDLPVHSSFLTAQSTSHTFITFEYDFKSIALILSSGRAPPVVS